MSPPNEQPASALRFIGRWIARAFVLLSVFLLPYLYHLSRKALAVVWLPIRRLWALPIDNVLTGALEIVVAPWLGVMALTAGIFTVGHFVRRARHPLLVSATLKGLGMGWLIVTLVFMYWNWFACTLAFVLLGPV